MTSVWCIDKMSSKSTTPDVIAIDTKVCCNTYYWNRNKYRKNSFESRKIRVLF